MIDDDFRKLIAAGDVDGLRAALRHEPARANRKVRWYLNQWNESDPLHFVCDCVGNGWLANGREGEIAALLIELGAAIDGNAGCESPLIAAASLGIAQSSTWARQMRLMKKLSYIWWHCADFGFHSLRRATFPRI